MSLIPTLAGDAASPTQATSARAGPTTSRGGVARWRTATPARAVRRSTPRGLSSGPPTRGSARRRSCATNSTWRWRAPSTSPFPRSWAGRGPPSGTRARSRSTRSSGDAGTCRSLIQVRRWIGVKNVDVALYIYGVGTRAELNNMPGD